MTPLPAPSLPDRLRAHAPTSTFAVALLIVPVVLVALAHMERNDR